MHLIPFLEVVLDDDAVRWFDRLAHRVRAVARKDGPASDRILPSELLRFEFPREAVPDEKARALLKACHPVFVRRYILNESIEIPGHLTHLREPCVRVSLLKPHQVVADRSAAVLVGQALGAHRSDAVRIPCQDCAHCLREFLGRTVADPEGFAYRGVRRSVPEGKEQRHE